MSVGCIEPIFFNIFMKHFVPALPKGFRPPPNLEGFISGLAAGLDRSKWGELREYFEAGFLTRTRDEWTKTFHGTDIVPPSPNRSFWR